jgi:hypothetical protein
MVGFPIRGIFKVRRTISLEDQKSDALEVVHSLVHQYITFTRPPEMLSPVQWRFWIVSLGGHVPEVLRQIAPASILSSERAGRY